MCCETKVIWKKHPAGEMSHNIWAPEIHYIKGKWYIYFCSGRAEEHFRLGCYLLECDGEPFSGTWTERGQISTGWENFALDMTTFIHRGEQYFVWAQMPQHSSHNSSLYISRCSDPAHICTTPLELSHPEYEWECRGFKVNEGPAVLIRNGKIFITYSCSDTGRNYCMGMLWADEDSDILDKASWHKSPEPVFQTAEENSQFGPGHNSFTTYGDEDVLVYHARSYEDIVGDPLYDPNRHARAKIFTYDKNGFPVFGKPPADNR
jgi:GH43 family beta-xylosidase